MGKLDICLIVMCFYIALTFKILDTLLKECLVEYPHVSTGKPRTAYTIKLILLS